MPDYLKITQVHHRYPSALTALSALFASSTLGDSLHYVFQASSVPQVLKCCNYLNISILIYILKHSRVLFYLAVKKYTIKYKELRYY